MTATYDDVSAWFDDGLAKGANHMLVVCDTFDHDNYPVYILDGQGVHERIAQLETQPLLRIDEVYSYSAKYTKLEQMIETRARHLD